MRKLTILLWVVALAGCSTVHVKTADCEATYSVAFRDLEAANFNICGGSAEVVGVHTRTELLQALIAVLGSIK